MIANYHTHTYRCHHAVDSERHYIERAIAGGIKYMGFSDHAPFAYPNGKESSYRVSMFDRYAYVEYISKLREEYKNDIDIKIGFEMEYYPLYFKEMFNIAKDAGAEYLILGQHSINSSYSNENISTRIGDSTEKLETYVREVCEAIETGVYSYVAHPDIANFTGDAEVYLKIMRELCETAKKNGVPLEINFLGIRDGRIYPRQDFWRIVGEVGCDVVYGCDAHDARSAYDGESLVKAEKMREEYGLHIIEVPKIVDIQKISV